MKFNIGDKVRFLNDVGGGKVIKYVDDETVVVLNDDDFEIPVPTNELIPDQPTNYHKSSDDNSVNSNKSITKPKEPIVKDEVVKEDGTNAFYLAFVPVDTKNVTDSPLKLFLINDSNYQVYSNVLLQYGAMHVSHPKTIQSNTKMEIKLLAKNDLNDIDSIAVQVIFYKNEPHKILPIVSQNIKVDPLKFYKQNTFIENDFFDEKAYLIAIFEESNPSAAFPEIKLEELKRAFQEKEHDNINVNKKQVSKTSKSSEIWEIDLHIHELLDDFANMSNKEIIDYQMDYFRKEMQNAINERVKKVIFIHGKGDGVLKGEIRQELKMRYKKYQFQDASFQQYGFGATAVYIS